MSQRIDVHQHITDRIVAAIEQSAGEFKLPWHRLAGSIARPTNIESGKGYRGINVVSLWVEVSTITHIDVASATSVRWSALIRLPRPFHLRMPPCSRPSRTAWKHRASLTACVPAGLDRRSTRTPMVMGGRDEGSSAGAEPRKSAQASEDKWGDEWARVPVPIPARCRTVGNGNWELVPLNVSSITGRRAGIRRRF